MDPNLVIDEDIKKRLIEGGMDDLLATHFAHLFIRDPIVQYLHCARDSSHSQLRLELLYPDTTNDGKYGNGTCSECGPREEVLF